MYLLERFKNFYIRYLSQFSTKTTRDIERKVEFIAQRNALTQKALDCKSLGIHNSSYFEDDKSIIVSLTTYGKSLYEVYLSIESIMQQTIKPNKIILWLADDMKDLDIPILLQNQVKRGLTIDYCKDIRSYKKLIPTLEKYPNDIIITIDDDIIYQPDLIEIFLNAYKTDPTKVYCCRMHRMKFDKDNHLLPYKNWDWECNDSIESPANFATGCGGIMYPPNCFHSDILKSELFTELCPNADDVWFYTMALLNNVTCKKVYTHKPVFYENVKNQETALYTFNLSGGGNDIHIQKVFEKYNIMSRFKQNHLLTSKGSICVL